MVNMLHIFTLLDCVARGVHSGGERHQGLEQQDLQGQARLHPGGQAHSSTQKVGDKTETCLFKCL